MNNCSSSIEGVKAWIDNNPNYDIVIDNVAARSGWSKWHLQRVFHEQLGMAIGEYLFNRRMKAAHDMLISGRSQVVVADLLGYKDQPSFQRAFKRKYGMSPKQYVKNHGLE